MFPDVDLGTLTPISTDWTYERVLGRTCSTPRAPAEETSPCWKPDSIHASARTSAGSSRYAIAQLVSIVRTLVDGAGAGRTGRTPGGPWPSVLTVTGPAMPSTPSCPPPPQPPPPPP